MLSAQVAELVLRLERYKPKPESKDSRTEQVNKTEGTSRTMESTEANIRLQ